MKKRLIILCGLLIAVSIGTAGARGIFPAALNTGGAGECITGNDANTVLLIHSNDSAGSMVFTDSGKAATSPKAITANGEVNHSAAAPHYGSTSIEFDGITDYLSLAASADWDFAAGDFTVAMWIKTADTNKRLIQNTQAGVGVGWLWGVTAGGALDFQATAGPTITTTDTVNDDSWKHIAMVRSGNDWIMFISGVSKVSTTNLGTITDSAFGVSIGANSDGSSSLNGYMDEIIVKKGAAMWTTDFTPPAYRYCD